MKLSMTFDFDSLEEAASIMSRFVLGGAGPVPVQQPLKDPEENYKPDERSLALKAALDKMPEGAIAKPKRGRPIGSKNGNGNGAHPAGDKPEVSLPGVTPGDALRTFAKKHGLVKATELLDSFGATKASEVPAEKMTEFQLACSL